MTLETNLSRKPYFDDFSETSEYYRILHKPAAAVQTRELNQVQSILQEQINKFGRSIFKEGSVIEGCTFAFDNKRAFIKINDNYTNTSAFTIADFQDQYIYNGSLLSAIIVGTDIGYISQAPDTNTLYIKYLNSVTVDSVDYSAYQPGDVLTIKTAGGATIGEVSVASNTGTQTAVGNVAGYAYAMSVTEGVIFKKGTFLYVTPQTVVVEKYNNKPNNVSVGFNAIESIVTAQADSSLYDNAAGAPNYSAPGADRLKIAPLLVVRPTTSTTNDTSFFSLADFKNGGAFTLRQTAQYSGIGIEMARRMYETNGNFVISPFLLTTYNLIDNEDPDYLTTVNLVAGRGLGYVEGYRVEYLNNNTTALRKGVDTAVSKQQIVTTNFGNFVYANEFAGEFGDSSSIISVEIHTGTTGKRAYTDGTLLSTSFNNSTKIGTAYVRGFALDSASRDISNSIYRIYLFNIQMNPGQNFADAKSLIYNVGGDAKGIADLILTPSATLQKDVATLQQTYLNGMIFPFGQRAIKIDGFNNTEFVYRKKRTKQVDTSGTFTVDLDPAEGTGDEVFPYSGVLSVAQANEFYIVPVQRGTVPTANFDGSIDVVTTGGGENLKVVGNGSHFLVDFQVGDYINSSSEERLIVSILSNELMIVDKPWTSAHSTDPYYKSFPVGAPIPFNNRPNRLIFTDPGVNPTVVNVNLGETIDSPFNVDIFHNVNRSSTIPIHKNINRGVFVKIDCSSHPNKNIGPWSLGIPDVTEIEGIWIGESSSYSNTGVDVSRYFKLDKGQRDTHYDLASINVVTNSPADHLTNKSTILVQLSCFTQDATGGKGFFSANSYPVNDTTGKLIGPYDPLIDTVIRTEQIPLYTTSKGTVFDLRDCVDFRPFAANTIVISTTYDGVSTIVNPSPTLSFTGNPYIPSPDSNFQSDIEYYMKRVDRAALDIDGNIVVTEGIPSSANPVPPLEKASTMTLGLVYVPPYPSLSTDAARISKRYDYAITVDLIQNKRFTMKDIGALENRIQNLEYYTSLSLLEQSAANLLVRSGSTGQNRFQNGIFVEPFFGFDLSNTIDPLYYVSIDSKRSEMRPAFVHTRSTMEFDAVRSGPNVVKHGELVMLNHTTDNVYITQALASKYRNCVEGNVYEWTGSLSLEPPGTLSPDITHPVVKINNQLDLAANWINIAQTPWGTNYGQWEDTPNEKTTTGTLFSATNVSDVTNADGSRDINTTNQVINNVTTKQQQQQQKLNATGTWSDLDLGTSVTGVYITPFLKAARIRYRADGMKPNTRVYAYFGNVAVTAFCSPLQSDYTGTGGQGARLSGWIGDPLYTDEKGSIYGIFELPAETFSAEDNLFELNDISTLLQGQNAIQTRASIMFYGSKLGLDRAQSILSVRSPVLTTTETTNYREVTGLQLGETKSHQYIEPPPPAPSGGGGGSGCGCGCFIGSTLVMLASGKEVPIEQIRIGDLVYNRDKTEVNTVKFIEVVNDKYFEKLYSPSEQFEPFATVNHPLYIDGELASVDPEMNINWYPWLGKNKQINVNSIVDASNKNVYNLWVDGDGTYTVNGYGTHSIIGDGGFIRLAIEQGIMTEQQAIDLLYHYIKAGKSTVYGIYLFNKFLGKIDNSFLNKLVVNKLIGNLILTKNNEGTTIFTSVFNSVFNLLGKTVLFAK